MKKEQIVILVVAFFLGMLLLNVVKNMCGCELKEGFDPSTPEFKNLAINCDYHAESSMSVAGQTGCGGTPNAFGALSPASADNVSISIDDAASYYNGEDGSCNSFVTYINQCAEHYGLNPAPTDTPGALNEADTFHERLSRLAQKILDKDKIDPLQQSCAEGGIDCGHHKRLTPNAVCAGETCKDDDKRTCCTNRARCMGDPHGDGDFECGEGYVLHNALCSGTTCDPINDKRTCCIQLCNHPAAPSCPDGYLSGAEGTMCAGSDCNEGDYTTGGACCNRIATCNLVAAPDGAALASDFTSNEQQNILYTNYSDFRITNINPNVCHIPAERTTNLSRSDCVKNTDTALYEYYISGCPKFYNTNSVPINLDDAFHEYLYPTSNTGCNLNSDATGCPGKPKIYVTETAGDVSRCRLLQESDFTSSSPPVYFCNWANRIDKGELCPGGH